MKAIACSVLLIAGLTLTTLFAPAFVEAASRRSRSVEVRVSKTVRAYAADCDAQQFAVDCAAAADCDTAPARKGIWPTRVKTRTRSRSRGESNCAGEVQSDCAGATKASKLILVPRPAVRVEVKVLPPEPVK